MADHAGMSRGPDYHLNLSSAVPTPASPSTTARTPRAWLAIRWRCCSAYSRIYKSLDGTQYAGQCPRCAKPIRVQVGQGGTASRFFEAG